MQQLYGTRFALRSVCTTLIDMHMHHMIVHDYLLRKYIIYGEQARNLNTAAEAMRHSCSVTVTCDASAPLYSGTRSCHCGDAAEA